MRDTPRRNSARPGIALVMSIFAMLIIGALVIASLSVSAEEHRIGRNALLQARADAAAELGLHRAVAEWKSPVYAQMPVGGSVAFNYPATVAAGASAAVNITRLSTTLFVLVSEGRIDLPFVGGPRRRLSHLIRLDLPIIAWLAALSARSLVRLDATTTIDGSDTNPSGWSCPAAASPVAAVALPDSLAVALGGCTGQSCLTGSPKILQSVAAGADSSFTQFGDVTWSDLAARATHRFDQSSSLPPLAPRLDGDACDVTAQTNWGDPTGSSACRSFFPIVYARADLAVAGGSGQGILLVEGNLDVSGGFEFFGPVIVKGRLTSAGAGAAFHGGVMAGSVDFQQTGPSGRSSVTLSRCAVITAFAANSLPIRVVTRAWSELF